MNSSIPVFIAIFLMGSSPMMSAAELIPGMGYAKLPLFSQTYTVRKGDTVKSIARKFKVSVADLENRNGIKDPKKLRVGQKLLIPSAK